MYFCSVIYENEKIDGLFNKYRQLSCGTTTLFNGVLNNTTECLRCDVTPVLATKRLTSNVSLGSAHVSRCYGWTCGGHVRVQLLPGWETVNIIVEDRWLVRF